MLTLIICLIVAIGFVFLVYSGYTLAGIYDRQGTNTYGKYKIKTFETKDGKKVYVPLYYVGRLFFKPIYYPYDAKFIRHVENLGEGYYGWYNKMECIDHLENEWNDKLKKKEYKKRLHNLSK